MWGQTMLTEAKANRVNALSVVNGCPTRTRTLIDGVRVRSLTIRGSGNEAAHLG